jgi:uncharacterized membrane protein
MATLTVLIFATPDGAQKLESTVLDLQKQNAIDVLDAAIVTWPQGAHKPTTREMSSFTGANALLDDFWGMLFSLLFFVPLAGLDISEAATALGGRFSDYGIDYNFVKQTQEKVTQGTSALFPLTTGVVLDKVVAAVKGQNCEVISTNLPREKEAKLRAAFGAD